ncbi:MAG: DotA/TraY family protein [Candidatus Hydrogenedentes bacterium]|nr:DotA/TraY family protein [Candidatus Hydrogenedentota bacterium]
METPSINSMLAAAGDAGRALETLFKDPAFGDALLILNLAIGAVAVVWVTYIAVAAIMQSAWDGEFLGKRFHSLWAPIRLALGFAALIPAFDGWNAAEIIFYQTAKLGAGLGNIVLSDAQALAPAQTAEVTTPPAARELALAVLFQEVCKESIGAQLQYERGLLSPIGADAATAVEIAAEAKKCGESIPSTASDERIRAAHDSALAAMRAEFQRFANQLAAHRLGAGMEDAATRNPYPAPHGDIAKMVDQAAERYQAAVMAAAQPQTTEKPSNNNWIYFGFQFSKAAIAQARVNASVVATPTQQQALSPDTFSIRTFWADTSSFLKTRLDRTFGVMGNALQGFATGGPGGALTGGATALGADMKMSAGDLLGKLFSYLSASLNRWAATTSPNPVALAQSLGQTLITGVGEAGAIAIPLSMVPAIGEPVMTIFMAVAAPAMLVGGALVAYVPMLPAIFWLMALIGWVLRIFEGIVMASLWAFSHLDPNGEGMGERTSHGYIYLVNILLRPAFLVIAFAMSSKFVSWAGTLLQFLFAGAIESSPTWEGLATSIALAVVYCYFMIMILEWVYAPILTLPDFALSYWLGGSNSSSAAPDKPATGNPLAKGEGALQGLGSAARGRASSSGGRVASGGGQLIDLPLVNS